MIKEERDPIRLPSQQSPSKSLKYTFILKKCKMKASDNFLIFVKKFRQMTAGVDFLIFGQKNREMKGSDDFLVFCQKKTCEMKAVDFFML